jgi:hypothetical protein
MPDELEAAVHRASADPQVKVILLRGAERAFCAGFDFGGGFHHWDAVFTTDGVWDPGKDFALAASDQGAVPKFIEPVALAQAGDRAGARLVRGRRQRHGAVRGPRDRQRGRAHRQLLLAHVGLLPDGHVAIPAGVDEGQGVRAERQAAVRRGGRGGGPDQRGGAFRAPGGGGARARRAARRDPRLAARMRVDLRKFVIFSQWCV